MKLHVTRDCAIRLTRRRSAALCRTQLHRSDRYRPDLRTPFLMRRSLSAPRMTFLPRRFSLLVEVRK